MDAEIITLLRKLSFEDLNSLTFTTTKGLVKPGNKEDAIQAIVMFSEDPSILLRSRKIKRELLFQYLLESGVQVSVNGTKKDYIDACLRFWGNADAMREQLRENVAQFQVQAYNIQANRNPVPQECQPSYEMNFLNPIITYPKQKPVPPPFVQQIVQMPNTELHNQVPIFYQQHQGAPVPITEIIEEPNHPQELGTYFVNWLYKTLNGDSPNFPNPSLVPERFWPDCTIEVYMEGNDHDSKYACIQGANNILLFFKCVLNSNRLYVVPEMESIRTNHNSHGVVKITVKGIMHQIPNVAGLFEQVFILIRDPAVATEVRKIRNTMLRMKLNCPLQDFLQCQEAFINMIFN